MGLRLGDIFQHDLLLASWNEAHSIGGTSMSVWLSVGLSNIFQVPKDLAVYGR